MYNSSIMEIEFTSVATTELRDHGSDVVNRVAYGDEEIVLTRHGKPIAALVSLGALDALHRLEDAEDAARAAAAREDARKHGTVSLDDVKARYGL